MSTIMIDHNSLKTTEIKNPHNICSVAFTPDGKHVVGGDAAGGIRRWKMEDAQQVEPAMATGGQVTTIAVSKDAQWIVTGDWQGKVLVWNASTHQKALEIPHNLSLVWAVDITSDSSRIAAGSNELTTRIFSIITGASPIPPIQHNNSVTGLKFSPAGDRIATTSYETDSFRIYNTHTGEKLLDVSVRVRRYPITPIAWSPDGQQVFVVSPGKITCLNTSTSASSEWPIHNTETQASIVTNGRFIACSAGTSVSFWDAVSHKQIGRILQHTHQVQCIALSPDERSLACGNGTKISFYQLSEILPSQYVLPPASRPPLMEVSFSAIEAWTQGDVKRTEAILSHEIGESNSNHNVLANRALTRARLKQWSAAIDDANMSLQTKPSPIGYLAKTLALIGTGQLDPALLEFDFTFYVCDPNDVKFLCVIKAIVTFMCGRREDAIIRMRGLIANADEESKNYCLQVQGSMYLKKADYETAIQSFQASPRLPPTHASPQLMTISLIFGWNFEELETVTWKRLCESLYASGRIKDVGESLLKMVSTLAEDEKESAHCRILEEVVTCSGDVTLLSWTGQCSAYNSCLPASPSVYTQMLYTPPNLGEKEIAGRTAELRTSVPQIDAHLIHDRVTRLWPVRFTNRHLHLPCLVFRVQSLSNNEANTYLAKATGLGDVEFITDDTIPLNEPRRLVFVHPWLRLLCDPQDKVASEDEFESDADVNMNPDSVGDVDSETEIMRISVVEEAPLAPLDTYTRALQLIARLGQPFNALLFLKQSDGTYKRVAADHEIVVPGLGSNIAKDIRAEVLEVV